MNNVNVVIKESKDLDKTLKKTAKQLNKKFTTKRKINEKLLKTEMSKRKKIILYIIDIFLMLFCAVCCTIGINSCIFRLNKVPPSFFGYSILNVISDSMLADGFKAGETIVVRKINTKSLNVGDNIAFYLYAEDYNKFDLNSATIINKETKHDYKISFNDFIGIPSKEAKKAINANAKLIFHKITKIYEDSNGNLWFKTKGSSNEKEDGWFVSEAMVFGIHNTSNSSNFFEILLTFVSNNLYVMIIICIPLILMLILIIISCAKNMEVIKLIQDCVEEKRKITDEICVKNEVGFNMDKRTKLKILAQASDENRSEYVALLWKDGSAPSSIRKYVIRRQFLLKSMQKKLELNRECEKMFHEGIKPEKIATHYLKEKSKLDKAEQKYLKLLKKIKQKNKNKLTNQIAKDNKNNSI